EHYARVLELTGIAAAHDDLETVFPLYSAQPTRLRLSRQCEQMLARLEQHRDRLAAQGFIFGRSRLAVRGEDASGGGCIYCRLCMYGCPYGHIYNAAESLERLKAQAGFGYESGVVVTAVEDAGHGAVVRGYDLQTRAPRRWDCDRVFLAAGAIPTTAILLRSLGAHGQTVWLRDSQYFLLPLLQTRRVAGATQEPLHALCQLFLEWRPPGGPERAAHVQIYSNSDLINEAVARMFGPLQRPLGALIRQLQERLLVAQGYLHSALSSRIAVRLCRPGGDGGERVELRGEVNPATARAVRRLAWRFCGLWRSLGALPALPMLKIAEPGRSFHSGGSFPMRRQPGRFETDWLGRPAGLRHVHAVDATVFPSIPPTTITLLAMANAHRIGWQAAQLGAED
ncbi:MAG: hypothetical protein RMK20_13555, partial [Verrucomicrobiales bacterium]|nr:hypothetical protein [Verrucomicrobiales bacterium]